MKKGDFASILVLAVLAVFWAGCGGDSETSDEPLTKAQVMKQAEVVCQTFESEREEILNKQLEAVGPSATPQQLEDLLIKVLKPYEEMIEKLVELGAPQGDEKQFDEMTGAMEEAVKRAKANPESVFTNNLPFVEANKQVEAYGLDNCVA